MTRLLDFASFLPTALFFTLWIVFPVWLFIRRSQGLIRIERTNKEGEREQLGMGLELMTSVIVIPSVTFFFIVFFNLILSPFISDLKLRFQKSLESAFMLVSIALFVYIYLAEKKIYLRELKRRHGTEEDGPD